MNRPGSGMDLVAKMLGAIVLMLILALSVALAGKGLLATPDCDLLGPHWPCFLGFSGDR